MATPLARSAPLMQLLNGFRRSQVLFTAVKLGVFEELKTSPNSNIKSLATKLKCDEDSLENLLNGCVFLDLIQKDQSKNTYMLNKLSEEFLLEDSDFSMTGYVHHSNDILYNLWGHLKESVHTGKNVWTESFSKTSSEVFENIYKDSSAKKRFTSAMESFSKISSPTLVGLFDLEKFKKFTDLGGGSGILTIEACKKYSNIQGEIVELPSMSENIQHQINKIKDSSVKNRVSVHLCDFFKDDIPVSDLYSLSRILHDWDLKKINILLQKIYQKLPNGGALLVFEKVMNEDKCGDEGALLQSLNMRVQTEGIERTFLEYEQILKQIGFRDIQFKSSNGHPLDAIIAYK